MLPSIEVFVVGLVASIFGSIVGLGGGFVVIPILRLFFGIAPGQTAGTSLVLVLAAAGAAAFGYIRQKRVDLGIGNRLAIGAVPGSVLGVVTVKHISGAGFDIAYAVALIVLAINVLRPKRHGDAPDERPIVRHPVLLTTIGVLMGFFSSLFGIGGGVVLIPFLLLYGRVRPHVVAATSTYAVLLTAPVGVAAHVYARDVDWHFAVPLVVGGLAGGTLGPLVAKRVSSPILVRLLGCGLIFAALGMIARHVVPGGL
jgi:uncharacterized membrane protein YfcA